MANTYTTIQGDMWDSIAKEIRHGACHEHPPGSKPGTQGHGGFFRRDRADASGIRSAIPGCTAAMEAMSYAGQKTDSHGAV